jgi:glycosyltransferase involved in cell wall biosynthesis
MNLLFDLSSSQPNLSGKYHGGGKYGEMVFYRMIEHNIKFSCTYDSTKWFNPLVKEACQKNNIKLYDISNVRLTDIVSDNRFDTVYAPLIGSNLYELKKCRVVGTMHGLRMLETPIDFSVFKYKKNLNFKSCIRYMLMILFPEWKKNRYLKSERKRLEGNIDYVVVSDHTKYSIQSFFPDLTNDIQVFYSPNTSTDMEVRKSDNTQRYFLMVSGCRWEKNVLRAIEAFDRLVSAGRLKGVKAVVTGCYSEDFRYKIENPESFEFVGYVSDSELQKLYANAYIFVYPTLNEGFGYPPLEAMRYSVPVIASPYSSVSDILGGSAMYFNPQSVEEIMSRMLMMMLPQNHDLYSKLGFEQYKRVRERQVSDLDKLIDFIIGEKIGQQ